MILKYDFYSLGIKIESYCGCISTNEDGDPIASLFDSDSTVEISLDIPKYLTDPIIYAQIAVLYPFSLYSVKLPSFINTQTIRANVVFVSSISVIRQQRHTRGFSKELTEQP